MKTTHNIDIIRTRILPAAMEYSKQWTIAIANAIANGEGRQEKWRQ
jgi:hypothetical protein